MLSPVTPYSKLTQILPNWKKKNKSLKTCVQISSKKQEEKTALVFDRYLILWQQRTTRGSSGGSPVEWTDMLMVFTAESPGFALRNFTESVQEFLFFFFFSAPPCEYGAVCLDTHSYNKTSVLADRFTAAGPYFFFFQGSRLFTIWGRLN